MNDKLNLHFVSSITGSIGEITQDLYEGLKKQFNITREWEGEIPDDNKRDILLCHFLDLNVTNSKIFNEFKLRILIQPIDGTHISKEIIKDINKFDLVICPAKASKKILVENDVTTRIEVIPNYYKSDIFEKDIYNPILDPIPQNKIVFYHESTFHPRKGIELLYEGFVKAFSDNEYTDKVCLIVKDMSYNKASISRLENFKQQVILLQKKYKKPAKIYKYSCLLQTNELKELWNRANVYVSLAKIEGFGIPMLRMHLMDKPIICLENENSGYNDFLNKTNTYFIPTIQHTAKNEFMWLYTKESKWAVPNITNVINTFRKCMNDYLSENCKSASNPDGFYNELSQKLQHFSFENVINLYIETIKKYFKVIKPNSVVNDR